MFSDKRSWCDMEINATNMGLHTDVRSLASSFLSYKIGDFINRTYFPVILPVGLIGNLLSFLVMIQKRNRRMSFSLYISVLAVTDSLVLITGFLRYLNITYKVDLWPNFFYHCVFANEARFTSSQCSTLLILSMTFERFYSIIRPHKAASFNTVKRAKITIVCIVIFSIVFNIPHAFVILILKDRCIPFEKAMDKIYGQIFYWASFTVNFALPFVLLLIMNCIIIHELRKRSLDIIATSKTVEGKDQGQSQSKGHDTKVKNSEKQIYVMLLLVTFTFLVLTTPIYILLFDGMLVNNAQSPESFAVMYLSLNVGDVTFYTNYAVNFFLYVISGKKFRTDLVDLFKNAFNLCPNQDAVVENASVLNTASTAM